MLPAVAALIKFGLPLIAGAIASKGQEVVQEKLGIDLSSALGTEDGRIKLKQLEMEHQEFLINAAQASEIRDLEYFREEVKDRDSARGREVEIEKVRGAPWWAPAATTQLAFVVVIGGGWIFYNTAETDIRYAVVSIVTLVLSYYFGTTRGSGDKDRTFADLLSRKGKS